MIPALITPAIAELLALHELLRRMGFAADDIYVDAYNDCERCKSLEHPHKHVQMALRRGGASSSAEFTVDIWEDCTDVLRDWPEAVEWWNKASRDELSEVFLKTDASKNTVSLLMALERKGVELPVTMRGTAAPTADKGIN